MKRLTAGSVFHSLCICLLFLSAPPLIAEQKNSDVDNIGDRNINKRQINFMSLEKEIALGRQLAAEVEKSSKLITDPVITEYVNRVGQNLVRNSDAKVPFTIKVIDSDDINAFALPGGYFFVNTGLILAADEEAELAGVMAHEIAHVAARHGTEQYSKAQLFNYASIPLIFVGGGIGYGVRQAFSLLVPLQFLKFSRSAEREADYLGVQYAYKTGYDPAAFISFFEKIKAQEKHKPGRLAQAFATHPPTDDRIRRSQEEIEKILPDRPQYVLNTSEFDKVKARLIAQENRKRSDQPGDSKRPTLRRKTHTSEDDSYPENDTDSDDSRPTLKRRTS